MVYLRALSISIMLHFLILILFAVLAPPPSQNETRRTTIVELLEDAELARRPTQLDSEMKDFVRSAPAPSDLLTDEEKKKRFASEREQNVIKEQQARQSGMTANRSNEVAPSQGAPERKSTNRRKLDFKPASPLERFAEEESKLEGDLAVGEMKKEPEQSAPSSPWSESLDFSRFGSVERGVSTIGEALPPDIGTGDFTALNTDRHLYYTFYSRIEEKIRGRWVNYIKAVVWSMENGTDHIPTNSNWTTKLEIVLDRSGGFMKAILHESSGSRNLDSAPVQAFRDAHQFPNPPEEMVKQDGTIRLMYAFSVNIVPSYAAGTEE